MFDTELKYFIDNQNSLVKKYGGKVLVLRGEAVAGVYDDELSAYLDSKSKYEAGTFMIQPCAAGRDAYTMTISPASVLG